MKRSLNLCILLLLALGAALVGALVPPASAAQPNLTRSVPLVLPPPDEASRRIMVPSGFAIRIFAQGLSGQPRFMAFGPDGILYLTLMSAGKIGRLPDRNKDGLADGTEIVAAGLSLPHGLEWRGDWLYVAEGDKVERLRDSNGAGQLETWELVTTNIPAPQGHVSRTLHFGPDGKLYVSVGSSCNVCQESDPRRAAILRFNADGSIPSDNPIVSDPDPRKRPVWAVGLRNSVDFLWTPDGQLWANHNGSDGISDTLPPEEIVIAVQLGRHHGWPYCYTPGVGLNLPPQHEEVRDTRIALPAGFTCSLAVPALLTDLAHSAPLGMTHGGGNFPSAYRNDLFVAYHGSWNTNNPANYRDCKVQRIVIENGVLAGSETFANGWRTSGQKCGTAWGRPADVIFGPDGALYISDDLGGRVYRVVYVP